MEELVPVRWTDWGAARCPTQAGEELMRDLVPGGYVFTHIVFWSVVSLVALGTNAVAIILSVGVVLMAVEAFQAR
jgi:hypothetical protein